MSRHSLLSPQYSQSPASLLSLPNDVLAKIFTTLENDADERRNSYPSSRNLALSHPHLHYTNLSRLDSFNIATVERVCIRTHDEKSETSQTRYCGRRSLCLNVVMSRLKAIGRHLRTVALPVRGSILEDPCFGEAVGTILETVALHCTGVISLLFRDAPSQGVRVAKALGQMITLFKISMYTPSDVLLRALADIPSLPPFAEVTVNDVATDIRLLTWRFVERCLPRLRYLWLSIDSEGKRAVYPLHQKACVYECETDNVRNRSNKMVHKEVTGIDGAGVFSSMLAHFCNVSISSLQLIAVKRKSAKYDSCPSEDCEDISGWVPLDLQIREQTTGKAYCPKGHLFPVLSVKVNLCDGHNFEKIVFAMHARLSHKFCLVLDHIDGSVLLPPKTDVGNEHSVEDVIRNSMVVKAKVHTLLKCSSSSGACPRLNQLRELSLDDLSDMRAFESGPLTRIQELLSSAWAPALQSLAVLHVAFDDVLLFEDNFEHVPECRHLVHDVVQRAPNLVVLDLTWSTLHCLINAGLLNSILDCTRNVEIIHVLRPEECADIDEPCSIRPFLHLLPQMLDSLSSRCLSLDRLLLHPDEDAELELPEFSTDDYAQLQKSLDALRSYQHARPEVDVSGTEKCLRKFLKW